MLNINLINKIAAMPIRKIIFALFTGMSYIVNQQIKLKADARLLSLLDKEEVNVRK